MNQSPDLIRPSIILRHSRIHPLRIIYSSRLLLSLLPSCSLSRCATRSPLPFRNFSRHSERSPYCIRDIESIGVLYMVLGVRVPRNIHTSVATGSETTSAYRWAKEGQAEFLSPVHLATRFDSAQRGRKVSIVRNSEAMEPQAKVQKLDVSHDSENGHSNGHEKLAVAARSLRVKKLSPHAIVPSRGSALAAGYDLSSAYESVVPARGKALVKTDLSIAIPDGTYGRVAPRSGLAWKHSIDVGAGVIDADYRGPVGVILFNHSDTDFIIKSGDRIAQLVLELIVTPDVLEVEDLDATVRGEGGFGSTGISLVVEK